MRLIAALLVGFVPMVWPAAGQNSTPSPLMIRFEASQVYHSPDLHLRALETPSLLAGSRPVGIAPTDSLPDGMPLPTRLLWGRNGLIRLIGLSPSTRQAELDLRRGMLQWHQRLGLVTFAAMTTQVILGEMIANNPAEHYNNLQPIHRTLGYATFGVYMGTATLSLGAPPARRYGDGFSSVRLHRYLAIVHFAGMIAQPILGYRLAGATTTDQYNSRLKTHRWVGRITYGAFSLAMISIFLPY